MLAARENRAGRQKRLLTEYGRPLLSFTMNIPGPVKDSPLIRRAFFEGVRQLEAANLPILWREEQLAATGCELLCAVDARAEDVKRRCLAIEDGSALGRLFDMDVIDTDGRKLDRSVPRGCIVCGAPGRGCASRRTHTAAELRAAAERIITEHFAAVDGEQLAALAVQSLLDEVDTTPKPGLVDRRNNGSHSDMTRETFYLSAGALAPYWRKCFEMGRVTADRPPEKAFRLLREEGRLAEQAMFAVTGGVNTHKGAIFSLGTVCGAIGRIWRAEAPCRDASLIAGACAQLCAAGVEKDWAALKASGQARTAGERLYLQYGLTGIRGELAQGLPGVLQTALPAFESALADGLSRNDAGVLALLRLIARGTDTNMIARGGMETAESAAAEARALLAEHGGRPPMASVSRLDERFIERALSPGGCADLLAVTLFIYDWGSAKFASVRRSPSRPAALEP